MSLHLSTRLEASGTYGTGAVPGPVRAARRRGTVPDAARSRGAEMRTHRGAVFAQIVT